MNSDTSPTEEMSVRKEVYLTVEKILRCPISLVTKKFLFEFLFSSLNERRPVNRGERGIGNFYWLLGTLRSRLNPTRHYIKKTRIFGVSDTFI